MRLVLTPALLALSLICFALAHPVTVEAEDHALGRAEQDVGGLRWLSRRAPEGQKRLTTAQEANSEHWRKKSAAHKAKGEQAKASGDPQALAEWEEADRKRREISNASSRKYYEKKRKEKEAAKGLGMSGNQPVDNGPSHGGYQASNALPSMSGGGHQAGYAYPSTSGGGHAAGYGQPSTYGGGYPAGREQEAAEALIHLSGGGRQAGYTHPSASGGGHQAGYGQPSTAGGGYPAGYGQPSTAGSGHAAGYGQPSTAGGGYPAGYGQPSTAGSGHAAGYGQPSTAGGGYPAGYGQPSTSGHNRAGTSHFSGNNLPFPKPDPRWIASGVPPDPQGLFGSSLSPYNRGPAPASRGTPGPVSDPRRAPNPKQGPRH